MKRSVPITAAGLALAGSALIAAGATSVFVASPRPALAAGDACASLQAPGLFDHTAVTSSQVVAADAAKAMPAYCEVTAVVTPVAGSSIGVVYRLPEDWNGKMLGLGGGGWAGNVRIEGAAAGLKTGYATAQTDGGHPGTSPWDTAWASNPESIKDFSYRAIHLMTATGKAVVARYYGKRQSKAYYQGCSTGGRQGLMEVQRFPNDYDGVIAGAPVYNLLVQTSAVIRNHVFNAPDAGFTADQLSLVNRTVLKACDAKDGLVDGVIANPAACTWDPAELQCKAGAAAGPDCLSEGQVNALRAAYRGVRSHDGRIAAWPLLRGGEVGWSRFISTSGSTQDTTNGGGLGGLRGPILGDPNFDMTKFDPDTVAKVRSSAFARTYEANDPAISAFVDRGGKLLLWHGWSDPGPSPVGTITYYKQVQASVPAAGGDVQLFLAPGVYHCGGGPGPDQIDLLSALDRWVQTGQPPQTLLATKANSKISRPLCPYPAVGHYEGAGDPDDAKSFECR